MSERAIAFVEEWVSENVEPEGAELEIDSSKAASLAARCLASAIKEGITEAEMSDAFEDLTEFMQNEIDRINEGLTRDEDEED
jgi:hypothetical protein